MSRPRTRLAVEFVDLLPEILQDGVVYVSIRHTTVVHRCACGCGLEVVTPLAPNGWKLTYDGNSISLRPSIGNVDFPCRSHYWLTDGRAEWLPNFGAQVRRERRTILDWLAAVVQRVFRVVSR
ncbi:MAG: hypothetical protein K8R99_02655 [Actinomycetia bacterium]|nr:hypothetical protein [Actinomycetes bacterium]